MTERDRKPLMFELAEAAGVVMRPERLVEASQIAAANVELLRAELATAEFEGLPSDFVRVLRPTR